MCYVGQIVQPLEGGILHLRIWIVTNTHPSFKTLLTLEGLRLNQQSPCEADALAVCILQIRALKHRVVLCCPGPRSGLGAPDLAPESPLFASLLYSIQYSW